MYFGRHSNANSTEVENEEEDWKCLTEEQIEWPGIEIV